MGGILLSSSWVSFTIVLLFTTGVGILPFVVVVVSVVEIVLFCAWAKLAKDNDAAVAAAVAITNTESTIAKVFI